jgi:hypothetical protein
LDKVYVVSDKTPKPEEWWIVNKENAGKSIVESGGWLVTQDSEFVANLMTHNCRETKLSFEYNLIHCSN